MTLLDSKCKYVTFRVSYIEPKRCVNFVHLPVKYYAFERRAVVRQYSQHYNTLLPGNYLR
jgi:hypothetical protein